ncbi:MAG TPA: FGGY family carbohydrate kinase, partial [Acidimicrobiales bacterium]|nr:FGGY family carbohydrate kinase [Acidimicrobiales bacterium]
MSVLVIDVGTSGLRAAVVQDDARVEHVQYRAFPPDTPFPGLVEFDAAKLARLVLDVASTALAVAGPVRGVGITNQRASTIVWERATGAPVGPALGWQDLRTVMDCITWAEKGLRFAPNQSATKLAWLLQTYDPDRRRDLCFGTVDTWVAWVLSGGSVHATDRSNAGVTGLLRPNGSDWDDTVLDALGIPRAMMPGLVDSTGVVGQARALAGQPPIAGMAGDQQASLLGQGCIRPGLAKITFGTGGMLDLCTGTAPPASAARGKAGTYPIVAWTQGGSVTWGVEAIMLTAGANIDWLVEDLGLLNAPTESEFVAAQCDDTGGVVYVPALLGLGTPAWDYGARGTLLGLTRGSGRAEVVRAVLEGIAQRGADLVDAAEADTGITIGSLRVDGGMSANATFVQALADATGRPVEVSPLADATTLGAGLLAGVAVGVWRDLDEAAATFSPAATVAPANALDRDRWREALTRASGW